LPELPEVETSIRILNKIAAGRQIQEVVFPKHPGKIINVEPDLMQSRLTSQRIDHFTRRAKYIIVHFNNQALVIHQMLQGQLYLERPTDEDKRSDKFLRVRFLLDNGDELRFLDPLRLGRIKICADPAEGLPKLGPEPLDDTFTLDVFQKRMKTADRNAVLKPLLMEQSFIAGIGNVYADEALHIAMINPLRKASTLTDEEICHLYQGIQQALGDGLRYEGLGSHSYRKPDGTRGEAHLHLRAYRDRYTKGKPCPVCGGQITKVQINQRMGHYCAVCQPL
jgi:formamidopyrimidine-DNA glycosylase